MSQGFTATGTVKLTFTGSYPPTGSRLNFIVTAGNIPCTPPPQAAKLYFIHTDHLNTPRLIADEQQRTVWRWDNTDPFGGNPPDENPSGLGAFEFPLRFPGQYADKETNLHYNYFRDYDPAIGRYIQSDLIGLAGGINTYAYVRGSPLNVADPLGLAAAAAGAGAVEGIFAGVYAQRGLTIGKGLCLNPGINVGNIFDKCTEDCQNILPQNKRFNPSGGSQDFTSCLSGCMAGFNDCRRKPRSACPDPDVLL
jgi:RHS repeat-associated protein